MEHMFTELLTETTDINLMTELFPHQRISLFPSTVYWPYFAGFCHPDQGLLMPQFLGIKAMLPSSV